MKILAEVCVIPINGSTSIREEVAIAHQILKDTGCIVELHGYGTNIEGDFDQVTNAIKKIHKTLHKMGTSRIHTSLKISSRIDKSQSLKQKVSAVNALLQE